MYVMYWSFGVRITARRLSLPIVNQVYIYIFISLSLIFISLSLSIYIYICIYMCKALEPWSENHSEKAFSADCEGGMYMYI